MSKLFNILRGAVYAAGFTFAWALFSIWVQPLDNLIPFSIPNGLFIPGMILFVIGISITLWSFLAFTLTGDGTPAPFDPPKEFVATGPFRFVRNPMYIGGIIAFPGASLIWKSPSLILVAIIFWLVFHLLVILYEEPILKRKFGESYLNYKASTKRWIPRLKF